MRAVDGAGNRGPTATAGIRVSSHRPAPLPVPRPQPTATETGAATALPRLGRTRGRHPRRAGQGPPRHRRVDPGASRRLPGREPSLERGGPADRAPGGAKRVRRLPGLAPRSDDGGSASSSNLTSTGRRARRSGPSSAVITRSRPGSGLLPDPIVPLSFPADASPGIKSQSLHVEVYVPHTVVPGMHRGTLTLAVRRRHGIAAIAGRSSRLGLHAARSSQLPARDELLRPAGE